MDPSNDPALFCKSIGGLLIESSIVLPELYNAPQL